jgi:hypothetical protein
LLEQRAYFGAVQSPMIAASMFTGQRFLLKDGSCQYRAGEPMDSPTYYFNYYTVCHLFYATSGITGQQISMKCSIHQHGAGEPAS